MRTSKLLAISAAFVVVAAACGDDSDEPQPPAEEPPTETTEPPTETTSPADESLGDVPTVDDLAGVWLDDRSFEGNEVFWRFTEDGTWLSAFGERFGTTQAPQNGGSYELNGDTLSATNTEGMEGIGCPRDASWVWRVGVSGDGRLSQEWVESSTGCTRPLGTVSSLTRISPQSPAAEAITTDVATDAGEPITSHQQAQGIWRLEGTGQLLLIDEDGTYQLDDAGQIGADPDDMGSVEVGEDGTITFVSGPESRECSEGDRMTWTDTESRSATVNHDVVRNAAVLNADVTEDACRDLAGPLNWIRIVNS